MPSSAGFPVLSLAHPWRKSLRLRATFHNGQGDASGGMERRLSDQAEAVRGERRHSKGQKSPIADDVTPEGVRPLVAGDGAAAAARPAGLQRPVKIETDDADQAKEKERTSHTVLRVGREQPRPARR